MGNIATKRDHLLEYEKVLARRLARNVIDRPKPPIWMILIPVFFIFFVWKMKEYKNGIQEFVKNWMITRERCLDAAYDAVVEAKEPELEAIVTAAKELPPKVVSHYRAWVELLTKHYCQLLVADGNSVQEMIRNGFRGKSTYMLVLKQINSVEHTYHKALLPTLKGEREDLAATISKIQTSTIKLQRDQADEIYA